MNTNSLQIHRPISIETNQNKMRVILFPLPFQGHINPMLHLAQILHSKGFSITILHTHFNSLNPSSHPDFAFRSIPDGLSEADTGSLRVIELISTLNMRCVEPFRSCVAELVAAGCDHELGCLITDAHWHFTQAVADEFQIRRIVARTANISAFLALVGLPSLRQNGLLPSSETNLEDPVPNFPHLRVKDLPKLKDESPHLVDQLLSSILTQTRASAGLIFNSLTELEPEPLTRCQKLFPSIPIFPLGPFHKHLPNPPTKHSHSSISWLNTKHPKSVLYVSFGTVAAVDPPEFLEMAMGLANSNQPFLWVVRPGLVRGCEWPELPAGFGEMVGENGLIVKWAPQKEVLAHPAVGGFWTHSGWNSTIESLCEGVPMLCFPCFGDQQPNARYVSHVWGIGVLLEGKLHRDGIKMGIRKLMAEKENGEIMMRIKDLKGKVDCCIQNGGSTFQSLENLVSFIRMM